MQNLELPTTEQEAITILASSGNIVLDRTLVSCFKQHRKEGSTVQDAFGKVLETFAKIYL